MSLNFAGSPNPTLGVEIELQLTDPRSRELVPRSIELLTRAKEHGFPRIKAEVTQSMVEIDTEISANVGECREHLVRRLGQLYEVAAETGVRVAVSGAHPFHRWSDNRIFPSERYLYLLEKFRWLARRLTVYGVHVHVGVQTGEQAIAIANAAIRYLPHLLALSASSPYWEGVDTGMQSCRVSIMESFPISGLPYYFPNWAEFERYYDTLVAADAIRSPKDLYWFVRPSPTFGTLEFRICDGMPSLDDTLALVALIQALVVWIDEGLNDGSRPRDISMRRYWVAPENQWVAARDGLDGTIIVGAEGERRRIGDDVMLLLERLAPVARRLQSEAELADVAAIVARGTSAGRQRAVFRAEHTFEAVVDSVVAELEASVHR